MDAGGRVTQEQLPRNNSDCGIKAYGTILNKLCLARRAEGRIPGVISSYGVLNMRLPRSARNDSEVYIITLR